MHLDKSAFRKQSFKDAANHQQHYADLSVEGQSKSFNSLMSAAFGFVDGRWPPMDKTAFQIRKSR
jgi:hypothetical protein